MMSGKTLLFLSTGRLQACTWNNGALSAAQHFADNPNGHGQFAAFLQMHRDPIYLLADFVEEDFHYEAVPHLRGSERTALLQRKFEQYYRSTPFRQSLLLRRQQDGRRDDEMLFCALTNPALILPWLEIIQQHSMPLAGIWSVPGISASLVKDVASSHLLLLSWERHAGLRQTYFDGKQLYFSRLTQAGQDVSYSDMIDSEAARTRQYLRSLSLLPPGDTLDVLIICHAQDRHAMEGNLFSTADIHYHYLDLQELGQRLGSKTGFADSDATPLFLHLLAAKSPHGHYATAEHTHFFRLRQLRNGLLALSAAFAAISLLWGATNLWEASRLSAENESLKAQARQLSQQAQETLLSLPDLSSDAADMKAAVLLTRKLASETESPQKLLSGLGATLNAYPNIRVNRLVWQTNPEPTGTAPARPDPVINLSGELDGLAGGHRTELDYLERFQQSLTQRGYGVTALSLPLDVSPQGSISTGTAGDSARPAQFSLKITWRPKQ